MSANQKFTQLNFDASQVAPSAPLDPIPGDKYNLIISDGEIKPTSDGSGQRLNLEFTVTEGTYKGRKVFDGLNIFLPNSPKAQEIGQQQLSAICHATGVIRLQDVTELFNKPFVGKIGFEERRAEIDKATEQPTGKWFDARNTFKGAFIEKPAQVGGGAKPGAPAPAAAAPKPGPAGAAPGATPPWANKPAAPAPAAATPPAAPAAPAAPKPAAPPAPPAPKPARKFFVYMPDGSMPIRTESEIAKMLVDGLPQDTQVSLAGADDGFVDANGWKPVGSVGIPAAQAPAAATAPGAPVAPPWARK